MLTLLVALIVIIMLFGVMANGFAGIIAVLYVGLKALPVGVRIGLFVALAVAGMIWAIQSIQPVPGSPYAKALQESGQN